MRINKIIFSIFSIGVLITGLTSCEDFVERYPRASMASEEAMNNLEGIEATMTGLYNRMQNYTERDIHISGELLTDQMDIAQTNHGRMTTYPMNTSGTASFVSWAGRYDDINRINMMFHYMGELDDPDQDRINQVKGEAHAMRAYCYSILLNIYARPPMYQTPHVQGEPLGVIMKTEPFLGLDESSFQERGTIDEGWQFVLDDFERAEEILPESNPRYPYRFTHLAVLGHLARTHLYMGNWEEAASYAERVIAHPDAELTDQDTYWDNWKGVPAPESMFESYHTQDDRPGMAGSVAGMATYFPEDALGYGDVILRQDLINLLEDYREKGDIRSELFYYSQKGEQHVAYQLKYNGYRGMRYWDNYKKMRVSEMYLIAAEAYAEMNELDDARDILTEFREHRMDEEFAEVTLATKEEIIDLVLTERRVEFFSEMSHRWFDLRRRGMDIPKGVPDIDTYAEQGPIEFEDYRNVGNIPLSELDRNPNAIQNPGY